MANRTSLRPGGRRGLVAGVLAALSSMMHHDEPVIVKDANIGRFPERHVQPRINWLKRSLIGQR
jgi:hypothetical protein